MTGINVCDEELIERYRNGDDEAFDCILNRYKNIVKKKASALYIAGGDRDDLIQEGMIGLYKAVKNYDGGRYVSFVTYASMCINRQMCTAITRANRKKHEPLNESISYDAPLTDEDGEEISMGILLSDNNKSNPEIRYIDEFTAEDMITRILGSLSQYEKQVIMLAMDGFGYVEIAARLGRSPKSIDNALNRIRTKVLNII